MKLRYTWWKDGEFYVGHLDEYPDYDTQGYSIEELEHNLASLYDDIASDEIPFIHHAGEIEIRETAGSVG